MKITQDVRDYAQAHALPADAAALEQGMAEKAREFREQGGEVYRPSWGNRDDAARRSRSLRGLSRAERAPTEPAL